MSRSTTSEDKDPGWNERVVDISVANSAEGVPEKKKKKNL